MLSDGRKVAAPRFLRNAARRLRKLHKALSRKQKGSDNRRKAVVRVARAHARVTDARRDLHHKLATTLIRDNQAVHVEDLAVVGLASTRLAGSVQDAGWSAFVSMLEYKAARHGRGSRRVDRWFPSTRACSTCGLVGAKLPLDVRSWTCRCGAVHDRDVNAAINIPAAGRADRPTPVSRCQTRARPSNRPRNRNPPEARRSRPDRNPPRSRGGGRQSKNFRLQPVSVVAPGTLARR
ncbi:RNA-guided endonuclease InsQ/TnpB family protein [Saccharothrix luteola]|uniref:RNA-guided endonuclease InsQ/TnpB family protein n=1 Tax=Saccharothrix luteola TaxID=2893018 RepID=UPI001E3A9686|nr:transposase [Saccharothrix luteola]